MVRQQVHSVGVNLKVHGKGQRNGLLRSRSGSFLAPLLFSLSWPSSFLSAWCSEKQQIMMFLQPLRAVRTLTAPYVGFGVDLGPAPCTQRVVVGTLGKPKMVHRSKFWATLTRRLGAQVPQGDPLGLFRSHYEWLAITIGQHTVSGNWDGAMTGRPDALGALQF